MKAGDVVRTIKDPLNPCYANAGLRKGMLGVITKPLERARFSDGLNAEVRFFEAPDTTWLWSIESLEVVDA